MKIRIILVGCLIVGSFGLSIGLNGIWGCGSSSTSTSTADTVAITGTVSGVAASSASVSALGVKRAITEAPVADDTVTCYNDEGTEIGTATTGSDGTYTLSVDESVLNPDGAESVTENIILESSSGYATFAEVTITADTTTVTVNADPDSTLAAQAMLKKLKELGCTTLGGCNFGGLVLDFDPHCFFEMERKKWELASTGEEGLQGEMGAMKDMMLGAIGAGDFGSYGEPGAMMQAFMDGTVDTDFQADAAAHAELFTGTDDATYTAEIGDALTSFDTMADAFADRFAGGVGAGVTALTAKGVVEAASDSLCGDLLADPDAMAETIKTMLASGSADEFATTFGSDAGVDNFYSMMKKYEGTDGDFAFDANWDPKAMMGLMGGFGGEFDSFDPDKMFETMGNIPSGGEGFDFHSWGAAMAGDFKDACGTATGDCSYDPEARADFWTAQVAAGTEFDPTADNFGTYDFTGTFTSGTSGGTDFSACANDPSSSACQQIVEGGSFTQGCFSNADCPSGETCNTTTRVCQVTQSGGSGGFAGSYSVTSSGSGCTIPSGTASSLTGTSPNYTGSIGAAPVIFNQTGPGSCTFSINSMVASACTFSGSGGSGSVISVTASPCNLMLTRQ